MQVVDICKRLLFGSGLEGWQLGKTRVFLRAGQLAQLEVGWAHQGPVEMVAKGGLPGGVWLQHGAC